MDFIQHENHFSVSGTKQSRADVDLCDRYAISVISISFLLNSSKSLSGFFQFKRDGSRRGGNLCGNDYSHLSSASDQCFLNNWKICNLI